MNLFFFLLFLVFFPTFCLVAEPNPDETFPPVVVTSTRLKDVEQEISRIPGKVIVITEEDIKELGAKTIQEILQY